MASQSEQGRAGAAAPARTVRDLARVLRAEIVKGDASRTITGFASLAHATAQDVSFVAHSKYVEAFLATRAAAVIVDEGMRATCGEPTAGGAAIIVVPNAELAIADVLSWIAPPPARPAPGVDPSARIAESVSLAEGVAVGPNALVGTRSRIGRNAILHAGVIVGEDVTIGDDCVIQPNVVIRDRVQIGNRVIVHPCSVIGADGFGYRWDKARPGHVKIPHVGTVVIEDDVEIGACTCIDRAKFGETRIGGGTKIDNQVQVAHNVTLGRHVILAGQTGIAGSANLGDGVIVGARGGILDHVDLAPGTMVAAGAMCFKGAYDKGVLSGSPARPHRRQLREVAALARLPELLQEIRKLREDVESLKKRLP